MTDKSDDKKERTESVGEKPSRDDRLPDSSDGGADYAVGKTDEEVTDGGADEHGEEKQGKRNAVAWFFTTRAALIVALVGLIVPVAALIFAVLLGGTVFDKAAIIWACAFVVQMLYRMRISHKTRDLVLAVVFGVVSLAFIVLYVLELTGFIP